MKKILVLAAFSIFCLTSCYQEVNDYPPSSRQTVDYITIEPNEWLKEESFGYAYATRKYSKISSYVFDYGTVLVYMIDGQYQNMLPYVYPDTDKGYEFLLTNRFDFRVGEITFIREASDYGYTPANNPQTFKVVVIQNQ